jgi:pimeloyl-ACP methyl ester carboxylesterase
MALSFEDTSSATVNGTALAYCESGRGDPLILVHGSVSDLRTWSGQFEVFSASYRTIAYSRRYARPNAPIPEGADDPLQVHVDDLASLIVECKAAPAHVIGHSLGGFVAILLAIQRPELVRSLTLVEPPVVTLFVDMPPKPAQLLGLFLRRPKTAAAILRLGATAMLPAEKAFRRGDDKAAIRAFGRGVLGKEYFERLSQARYEQVWDNRAPDKAQILGVGYPRLSDREIAGVDVPVLLICGRESPVVFKCLSDHLLETLHNSRKIVIEGASHIVHEDAPEAFNNAVLGFLRG